MSALETLLSFLFKKFQPRINSGGFRASCSHFMKPDFKPPRRKEELSHGMRVLKMRDPAKFIGNGIVVARKLIGFRGFKSL